MRVLVCGGRDFTDASLLESAMASVGNIGTVEVVIHGGAAGADTLAGIWANSKGIPIKVYRADWKANGKSAGPIRNSLMLSEGKPDVVVAMPGGRGTADMVKKSMNSGVSVFQYFDPK